MQRREYDESLYKGYVEGQNIVSKYTSKGQHSLRFDYSTIFSNIPSGKDATIVDVGCRDGKFVKHLHDLGYENSYGMDIGEAGKTACEKNYGQEWTDKHFRLGDVQSEFPYDLQCDFINLSHTLEHFYAPEKAMKNILEHLVEGGYLFIAVPTDLKDCGGSMDNLEKGSDYHWIFFENDEGVKEFLENLGLEIISIKHEKGKNIKVGEWQVICKKK